MPPGCLSVAVLVALLLLLPALFADLMLLALVKLGLGLEMSLLVLLGMFFGGMIDIPVRRIARVDVMEIRPFELFGFDRMTPRWVRRRAYTIIAVNVGGCLVPGTVAIYELARMAHLGPWPVAAVICAIAINSAVCYWMARPVPGRGIVMSPLVSAGVAALCGLVLLREFAPVVAFTAGVVGPLIGADLLHLRDIQRVSVGVASIGGAGTFDGIVLSALLATLLA